MNAAQVRSKARLAVKRREEKIEEAEMEGGELNLVPYLDIVTNIVVFLLATISAGFLLGNINTALPEYAESAGAVSGTPNEAEKPVQLVVAVARNELKLFSLSGQEGTVQLPKLQIPATKPGLEYDTKKLTAAAEEIVKRRWPDKGTRPDGSTEVILMADGDIPYHAIVAVMDAIRQSTDGTILFPDVIFSAGL